MTLNSYAAFVIARSNSSSSSGGRRSSGPSTSNCQPKSSSTSRLVLRSLPLLGVLGLIAILSIRRSEAVPHQRLAEVAGNSSATSRFLSSWQTFKVRYSRNYGPIEDAERLQVFIDNLKFIKEHNGRYERGLVRFWLGINQYADMRHAEFRNFYISPETPLTPHHAPAVNVSLPPHWLRHAHRNGTAGPPLHLPPSKDWRLAGVVTPVRDQLRCGSCWAHAAISALESHLAIRTESTAAIPLSVQQIIDCARDGNLGCGGGVDLYAYRYMQTAAVLTEAEYPYVGQTGWCRYRTALARATKEAAAAAAPRPRVGQIVALRAGNERVLRNAVALVGPVTVSLDGSRRTFQFYAGGVYADRGCRTGGADLNHVMLAVGYGVVEAEHGKNDKYWVLKNTMGVGWGERGYMRLRRNVRNTCGVASDALYPEIVD